MLAFVVCRHAVCALTMMMQSAFASAMAIAGAASVRKTAGRVLIGVSLGAGC
jgi:hypothetical protein